MSELKDVISSLAIALSDFEISNDFRGWIHVLGKDAVERCEEDEEEEQDDEVKLREELRALRLSPENPIGASWIEGHEDAKVKEGDEDAYKARKKIWKAAVKKDKRFKDLEFPSPKDMNEVALMFGEALKGIRGKLM